jgi:hypothetical protein
MSSMFEVRMVGRDQLAIFKRPPFDSHVSAFGKLTALH